MSVYPKAVVFDLDGTLIHSAPDLHAALNRLLEKEGRPPVTLEQATLMIGDGVPKLVERGFEATGGIPDADRLAAAVAAFIPDYEARAAELTRPFPGAMEVLEELSGAGVKLGVCTNKPENATRAILAEFGMDAFLSAVVGGDTLEGIRKPDARHLESVLERLGVAPNDTVMVGDNANDVAAARNASVPVLVMAHGYTRVPSADLGADGVVETFADLTAALRTARAA